MPDSNTTGACTRCGASAPYVIVCPYGQFDCPQGKPTGQTAHGLGWVNGKWISGPAAPDPRDAEIKRLRAILARIAGPWEPDDELTDLSARMRQAATEGLT